VFSGADARNISIGGGFAQQYLHQQVPEEKCWDVVISSDSSSYYGVVVTRTTISTTTGNYV
jgi:hypothetical protein